jgi:hypothetical protein
MVRAKFLAARSAREMAFFNSFSGYFVIHSPLLNPERTKYFAAELTGIGVQAFERISPLVIEKNDPRLAAYGRDGNKLVSLIDCFLHAIEIAERRSLDSIVIFEDDIKFRRNFEQLWSQIESKVYSTEWDILVLHRSSTDAGDVVIESKGPTDLVEIRHNTLTHCVILRQRAYAKFKRALTYCIAMGYPADFFYGVLTYGNEGTIYATTKNLTGQKGGLKSGLQFGYVRRPFFHIEFQCYRNKLEFTIVSFARRLVRRRVFRL